MDNNVIRKLCLRLNKQGFLERTEATKTVEKIAEMNRYIGKEIIRQFIGIFQHVAYPSS